MCSMVWAIVLFRSVCVSFIFLALPSGFAVSMSCGRKEAVCAFHENRGSTGDRRGMRDGEGDAGKLLCPPSVHEHCMSVLVTSASDYVLTPRHMQSRKCSDALST